MDLILYNGNIVTVDERNPKVAAIAIKNGKIAKVGTNQEIIRLKEDLTEVIDLKGKTMIPGLNDSHMHLLSYAVDLKKADLFNCTSMDEIIETIRRYIDDKNIPKGDWVQGGGWNETFFSDNHLPSRHDLDKISKDHPIILTRACCSIAVANTKALQLAGIFEDTPPHTDGGSIDIDDDGIPTGILRENARLYVYNIVPKISVDEVKELILSTQEDCLKVGLTSIQSDDFKIWDAEFKAILDAYFELDKNNQLQIRVNEQLRLQTLNKLEDFLQLGYKTGDGSDFFKIGPLKLLPDGSLGGRTAALREGYEDDKHNFGINTFSQEELNTLLEKGHVNGLQVAVHAIGDRAMDMAIECFEKISKNYPKKDPRFRIIHCQVTSKDILEKFKKNNIIADIQPIFIRADLEIAEKLLGKERTKWSYNWKTMLDKGIHVAGSSDSPVESFNPILGIYSAVTRKNLEGTPKEGWLPEQKLSVEEAVYIFTMGSAYSSFEEDIKGSITPGKFADLIVLSEDIFTVNPDKIKNIIVEKTFVGGKLVYEL